MKKTLWLNHFKRSSARLCFKTQYIPILTCPRFLERCWHFRSLAGQAYLTMDRYFSKWSKNIFKWNPNCWNWVVMRQVHSLTGFLGILIPKNKHYVIINVYTYAFSICSIYNFYHYVSFFYFSLHIGGLCPTISLSYLVF